MNWRLKCLFFYALQPFPGLHKFAQKYVTRRYLETVDRQLLGVYDFHVDNFRRLPPNSTAMEFGAGRNLLGSLLLSHAGAARVYAFDLQRLATVEQVNAVIVQLRELLGGHWPLIETLDDLSAYRIEYRAPGDARRTGLESVDFVFSTSTLEHIPADSLREIHAECARLRPSFASHIIDYHDHYASSDASISRTNFYRFGPRAWSFYNPSMHFQNRLRHSDQLALFAGAGFVPVVDRRVVGQDLAPELAPEFRHYSAEDLATMNSFVLLKRTDAGQEAVVSSLREASGQHS